MNQLDTALPTGPAAAAPGRAHLTKIATIAVLALTLGACNALTRLSEVGQVAGLIRPEDITSTNTINYDQIVEARIAYGGRGQITDVQQARYGQQIYDIIWPF